MALTTTTYATYTSVITMLPGLPQSTTSTNYTITAEVVSRSLERAYNLINTRLASRFATPFTSTNIPPMCQSLNEDLGAYYAMRSLYTRDAQNDAAYIKEHYDVAMTELSLLAEGKSDLTDSNGALAGRRIPAATKIQTTTDYPPVFELDTATSWAVSRDRLDDIANARDE